MSVNIGSAIAYLDLDMSGFQSGISDARSALQDFVSSTDSLSTKFSNLGSSMTSMGKNMTTSVTVPLVGLGTAMVAATASIETETKKITAYFGDVGEAAERNERLIEDIFSTGVTGSLESVSSAIISVRENLGNLGDAELKDIAEQAIYLDEVFGIDMNESLRGANSLMENFGLTATQAMDYLVKGTQEGLDKTHELGDNIAEYGQLWSQAGFSASEMFAILDNGLQSGAYNLDKVNDFVKEFTISLSDGRIEQNLESFSRNTQILFEEYKKGKATAKDVFYSLINDLETTMTKQEALTVASSVWSALGEDNALAVISSLNDVNDTFVDVTGTAEEFADTMGEGTSGSLATLKNNVILLADTFGEKLQPLIDNLIVLTTNLITALQGMDAETVSAITTIGLVVAAIGPVVAIIGKVISVIGTVISVGGKLLAGAKAVAAFISGVLIPAITAIGAPVWAVIAVIGALIAAGVALYKNWDEVCAWAKEAWAAITETVGSAVEAIGEFFTELGKSVSEIISSIGEWLSDLWGNISEFFSNLGSEISNLFSNIGKRLSELWSNVSSFFSDLWSELTNLVSSIGNWLSDMWDNISGFFSNLFSNIGTWFKNITESIGSFFKNLTETVSTAISEIWGKVVEWGTNMVDKAKEIASGFVDAFVQFFKNLIQSVRDTISGMIDMITSWGSNLLNRAREIGSGFTSAITSGLQKVGSFFSDIFTDILDAVTTLGPKLFEAGKNVIMNLWEGMKNIFSSVVDWITDSLGDLFKPISNMLDTVLSPVKSLFGKVGSFVGGLFGGSHANGLDYVPYNGYVAELHQGERVLTKTENEEYTRGGGSGGDTYIFNSPEPIDEYQAARLMKQTKQELDMDV